MVEIINFKCQDYHLMCSFHEGNINKEKEYGVIICQPFAHEYIRCYSAHLKLAQKLANEGFHVVRFDYSGTGDSSGNFENYTWDNWLENLNYICDLLYDSYGIEDFILIGTRLGGLLAAQFVLQKKIKHLVLLAPIIEGADYLCELKKDYKNWLNGSFINKYKNKQTGGCELFGYFYKEGLIKTLQGLSLKLILKNLKSFCNILMIHSNDQEYDLNEKSVAQKLINHEFWIKKDEDKAKNLVPIQEIEEITKWLKRLN